MATRKKILIVDDSEIDRMTLKNILSSKFKVVAMDNGYAALQYLYMKRDQIACVMLDVDMPILNGFEVLRLMRERGLDNIDVFMISAEATLINVERSVKYGVKQFIAKPFDAKSLLARLSHMFGETPSARANTSRTTKNNSKSIVRYEFNVKETDEYILKLAGMYKYYLKNENISDLPYSRVSDLMKLLLPEYAVHKMSEPYTATQIDIIAKAAYFYDLGQMFFNRDDRLNAAHTTMGANMVWLNTSPGCRFFVEICADICLHHHERFDGAGFPHQLAGDDISDVAQLCRLAIEFDSFFYRLADVSNRMFDLTVKDLRADNGKFDPDLIQMLDEARLDIIRFYAKDVPFDK